MSQWPKQTPAHESQVWAVFPAPHWLSMKEEVSDVDLISLTGLPQRKALTFVSPAKWLA